MDLIGQGRDADVYALGDGTGGPARAEARLMAYVAGHGYPVPRVFDAGDAHQVLERLDGPTMLAALRRRPWRAAAYGRMLAGLHDRLHAVPAPDFLPPRFPAAGEARVLHLDLHPANVLLTARGPYVIDWRGAAAGDPGCDVAMTVCILRAVRTGSLTSVVVRRFLRAMLRASTADPAPCYAHVLPARLADRNLTPAEARRLRRAMRGGRGTG